MSPEIVCVGQAVVDCIIRNREENPHRKNVFRAESISLSVGGDAVNEAVNLTRMGRRVRLVCGLGNDLAGELIWNKMSAEGIDTDFITVSKNLVTPVAGLLVKSDGGRSSVNSRATMLEDYAPLPEVVKGAKILSLASLFRAPLDRPETIIRLIKAAKKEGAMVCADTKLPTWRDISLREIEAVLPLIDYIFPNENEAAYYTGEMDFFAMAAQLRRRGVSNVIIKAGAEGCIALNGKERFRIPALPVKAVDSSGAGDSFVAGFLSALLDGKSFYDCLIAGTSAAAECVQHLGAWV